MFGCYLFPCSLCSRRRQWNPTPVLLPGKSHGRRSLVGCSPWGHEESDTTERLPFHFSLSFIGEGNGNPLQYSFLENPRDGGAWCASVYRVAQSWTRLKRLSSSSSSPCSIIYLFPFFESFHTKVGFLNIIPQVPKTLFTFFQFFFCPSDLIMFD